MNTASLLLRNHIDGLQTEQTSLEKADSNSSPSQTSQYEKGH
jgi:hypothetical protein